MLVYVVPSIEVASSNIRALSGETVTFECKPSDDLELFWTFTTTRSSIDTVNINNISASIFLSTSSLFHQLVLPIADVRDTGNYTCVVQGPPDENITFFQTITLTVLPGKLYTMYKMHIIKKNYLQPVEALIVFLMEYYGQLLKLIIQ